MDSKKNVNNKPVASQTKQRTPSQAPGITSKPAQEVHSSHTTAQIEPAIAVTPTTKESGPATPAVHAPDESSSSRKATVSSVNATKSSSTVTSVSVRPSVDATKHAATSKESMTSPDHLTSDHEGSPHLTSSDHVASEHEDSSHNTSSEAYSTDDSAAEEPDEVYRQKKDPKARNSEKGVVDPANVKLKQITSLDISKALMADNKISLLRLDLPDQHTGTTGDQVIDIIALHLLRKFRDGSIPFARMLGGWEGWLQVELATVLLQNLMSQDQSASQTDPHVNMKCITGQPADRIVKREEPFLLNKDKTDGDPEGIGKCDLFITAGANTGKQQDLPAYAIELKVAYTNQKGEIELLPKRFQSDMYKLLGGFNENGIKAIKGKRVKRLCVGVTSFPEDVNSAWDSQHDTKGRPESWGKQVIKYLWIEQPDKLVLNNVAQQGLALVWWTPDAKNGTAPPSDNEGLVDYTFKKDGKL